MTHDTSVRQPFDVRILPAKREGRILVELLSPICFHGVKVGVGRRDVVVPRGYISDLASIPRIARGLLPALGVYSYAAILHDFLYEFAPDGVTRREADDAFRSVMRKTGVKRSTRNIIYWAVSIGGKSGWENYRKNRQA